MTLRINVLTKMSSFPLYDTLYKEASDVDLTSKQKDDFMIKIKTIDITGAELIYALIRMYQMDVSDDRSTFKLPFEGRFYKNDMKFNLENFPFKLKQILYQFLHMHTRTMSEEENIEKNRANIST